MKQVYEKKEDCCGCGACYVICSANSITMQTDEWGFVYPFINEQNCIDCEICKIVCSFSKDKIKKQIPLETYAAINKNTEALNRSASGGVFMVLADYVLAKNGIIFGCVFNENLKAVHIGVTDYNGLVKMQGSKYVQSCVVDCYKQIKDYIKSDRLVLFTGTPCQVGALHSYLGKEYDNLITADLSCHGVPSPEFFRDYVNFLNKKYKIKIKDFCFRGKYGGWGKTVRIKYDKYGEEHDKLIQEFDSYYCTYFINRLIMRDSCYNCKYMSIDRPGDFTMCDYWGIEDSHPDIDSTGGVSALLINSPKGQEIIKLIKDNIQLYPTHLKDILVKNGSLCNTSKKPEESEHILTLWKHHGTIELDKEYQRKYRKYILKRRIIKHLPPGLKKKIKSYLRYISLLRKN